MAVGQGHRDGVYSYISLGRETTLGTYNTCTSKLPSDNFGLSINQGKQVIEEINADRVYSSLLKMGKVIEGDLSYPYRPQANACNFIIQQALGGVISSATATGETAGGLAFTHTVPLGNMDVSYTSLCINARKGNSTDGQVYQYNGVRVSNLVMSAELDSPLMVNASLIAFDGTLTSNDVESALTNTVDNYEVLDYVRGRISVESSFASLTSSSFWHVNSLEFSLNNNLKSDNESRRIGSDILNILPAGIAEMELKCNVRFDTTTAFDAMVGKTQLSAEFEFDGSTLATSVIRKGLKLQFPKVYVESAGDPAIEKGGGPMVSEVTFKILKDVSSASGYAVKALITNETANYD